MLRLSRQWRKDGERTTTSRAHFGTYPFTGRSLQRPSAQTCTSSRLVDLRRMSVLRRPKPWNKALRNWSHVCIDAGMRARPVLPSRFDRKFLAMTASRHFVGLDLRSRWIAFVREAELFRYCLNDKILGNASWDTRRFWPIAPLILPRQRLCPMGHFRTRRQIRVRHSVWPSDCVAFRG